MSCRFRLETRVLDRFYRPMSVRSVNIANTLCIGQTETLILCTIYYLNDLSRCMNKYNFLNLIATDVLIFLKSKLIRARSQLFIWFIIMNK
ncbi:hypothetical protein PUN28_013260 [Cardiocondyla obscurior]|uniref:Uncharacterized protein n=1 Tax=Cardiocondyla obscurior TaxID=286306 RepID=A0AAW2FAD2_9HYME